MLEENNKQWMSSIEQIKRERDKVIFFIDIVYTECPEKSQPLSNHQKIVLNRITACQRDQIYCQIKVLIKHVSIRYSVGDLLSDLNNYA